MDERLKFIARLLDGEKMAVVCREFGISRKTGYKILTRYNAIGLDGLTDRSRRPYRHANQLPFQVETQIVRLKQDKPSWGAPKSEPISPCCWICSGNIPPSPCRPNRSNCPNVAGACGFCWCGSAARRSESEDWPGTPFAVAAAPGPPASCGALARPGRKTGRRARPC